MLVHEAAAGFGPTLQFGGTEFVQGAKERKVMRTHFAVGGQEFIESFVDRLISGKQRGLLVVRRDDLAHVGAIFTKRCPVWRASSR